MAMLYGGSAAGRSGFITALYYRHDAAALPSWCYVVASIPRRRDRMCMWPFLAVVGFYLLCVTDGFGSHHHRRRGAPYLPPCCSPRAHHVSIRSAENGWPIALSFGQIATTAVLSWVGSFVERLRLKLGGERAMRGSPLVYAGVGSAGIAYTLQVVGRPVVPPASIVIMSLESFFSVIGSFSAAC